MATIGRALRGARAARASGLAGLWRRQFASSSSSDNASPEVQKALKKLYADDWYEIRPELRNLVEDTLKKGGSGNESLMSAWRAANAVEEFHDTLETLRQRLDGLMGISGENTVPIPDKYQRALEVAHLRYLKYLSSFGEDEIDLKKKVEVELGTMMIYLKQRCSGLGPKWGEVGLIGTSGLSGSYVEKRA